MTDEEKARQLEKECPDITVYDALLKMTEYKNDKFFSVLACIKFSLEKAGFLNGIDEFIDDIQKQWEE